MPRGRQYVKAERRQVFRASGPGRERSRIVLGPETTKTPPPMIPAFLLPAHPEPRRPSAPPPAALDSFPSPPLEDPSRTTARYSPSPVRSLIVAPRPDQIEARNVSLLRVQRFGRRTGRLPRTRELGGIPAVSALPARVLRWRRSWVQGGSGGIGQRAARPRLGDRSGYVKAL